MGTLKVILVLILAIALWVLYHKVFNVTYFDALNAILREIVICLLIAVFIVFKGCSAVEGVFQKDSTAKLDYLGGYYNLNLLNGSGTNAWISLSESESNDEKITISGYADVIGESYYISFEEDIPIPDDKTFTYHNNEHGFTIIGTIDTQKKRIFVKQESSDNVADLYTGEYVDNDTWQGFLEERRQATEDAMAAKEPNHWIEEYFGYYVPISEYYGEDKFILIDFNAWRGSCFNFILYQGGGHFTKQHAMEVPYPLGPEITGSIAYENAEDYVSFNVLGLSDDGRQIIEITDCVFPEYIGQFIAVPETTDAPSDPTDDTVLPEGSELPSDALSESEVPVDDALVEPVPDETENQGYVDRTVDTAIVWDGTYTCSNGGEDGTKVLTVSQVDAYTLSFYISHEYGDGRFDDIFGDAEIGTYGNGTGFASYENEKVLYFTLRNGSIEISQIGIYPAIDLEFSGTYVK